MITKEFNKINAKDEKQILENLQFSDINLDVGNSLENFKKNINKLKPKKLINDKNSLKGKLDNLELYLKILSIRKVFITDKDKSNQELSDIIKNGVKTLEELNDIFQRTNDNNLKQLCSEYINPEPLQELKSIQVSKTINNSNEHIYEVIDQDSKIESSYDVPKNNEPIYDFPKNNKPINVSSKNNIQVVKIPINLPDDLADITVLSNRAEPQVPTASSNVNLSETSVNTEHGQHERYTNKVNGFRDSLSYISEMVSNVMGDLNQWLTNFNADRNYSNQSEEFNLLAQNFDDSIRNPNVYSSDATTSLGNLYDSSEV